MLKSRSFWIILLFTAVVWVIATMSEHSDYPVTLRVEWTGFDTSRYVVTYADTAIAVTINSNCFNARSRYRAAQRQSYRIAVNGDTAIRVTTALLDDMVTQLGFSGCHGIATTADQLRLRLAERQRKAFVPQLQGVQFHFADQYGLSGTPRLEPDTVWLYGDSASLAKIDHLTTLPSEIYGISDSGYCPLLLDTLWRSNPNLRCSHDTLRLFIPVERYVEKSISVPVTFRCTDQQVRVHLYPERVEVSLWVSKTNYAKLYDDMVEAVVEYDPDAPESVLPVRITRFPSFARVKQVSPSTLQYVIIK